MNGVNLIPAGRRSQRALRMRLRFWVGGGVAYTILLFMLCGILRPHSAAADPGPDLANVSNQVTQVEAMMAKERIRLAAAEAALADSRTWSKRPEWSSLLAMLGKVHGEETVLGGCKLSPLAEPTPGIAPAAANTPANKTLAKPTPAGETITGPPHRFRLDLSGMGRSQAAVSAFVLRLQETGIFSDVSLLRTAREPFLAGEAIAFQIQCTLEERPKAAP